MTSYRTSYVFSPQRHLLGWYGNIFVTAFALRLTLRRVSYPPRFFLTYRREGGDKSLRFPCPPIINLKRVAAFLRFDDGTQIIVAVQLDIRKMRWCEI